MLIYFSFDAKHVFHVYGIVCLFVASFFDPLPWRGGLHGGKDQAANRNVSWQVKIRELQV